MKNKNLLKFRIGNFHLTKDTDLSSNEIKSIFALTDLIRDMHKKQEDSTLLKQKTLGMLFEKSSTRTRVSFEVGMYQLGGQAIHLTGEHIQMSRGESIEDTAKVLSRYLDAIMIRTYSQDTIDNFAKYSLVPVINGLSDYCHPCQSLTDFYTVNKKQKGKVNFCFIGDCACNVAISIAIVGSMLGHKMTFCSPAKYSLPGEIADLVKKNSILNGGELIMEADPKKAVKDAQFLYTDVWVSMGKEKEGKKRLQDFKDYAVTSELISAAKSNPYIMHCLPANWGQEISKDLKNYQKNIIFEQAENRLHLQKAVLVSLLKN